MKGRYLFAFILIVMGLGLLLSEFSIWSFGSIVSTWWPLLVITAGVISINKNPSSLFGGLIIIIVGLLLQASRLDMLPGGFWGAFWPVMIILLGLWLLIGKRKAHYKNHRTESNELNINVLFSGMEQRVNADNFEGGNINVMFGGAEIDLRGARMSKGINSEAGLGAVIDISVAFGGVELTIPADWKLNVQATPFMGGIENKSHQNSVNEFSPTLTIKGSIVLGGLEIKN